MIVSSILHNFRKTGKICLDSKGVATEVNFKTSLPFNSNFFEIGSSFVEMVPLFQKEIDLNDSLFDLTNQLRQSLSYQVKNKVNFRQMFTDMEGGIGGERKWKKQMGVVVSPCGIIELNDPIEDMIFDEWMAQETSHGFGEIVNYSLRSKSFFDYAGYLLVDPYIVSRKDSKLIVNDILSSLKKNTLNMKLIDALHNLDKTI
jgi:hypothetical protein